LENKELTIEEVKKLRASIVLIGPLLSIFKEITIFRPGGDIIGARPISVHLNSLRDLGCEFVEKEIIRGSFKKLENDTVIMRESSVTATETLLLFAQIHNLNLLMSLSEHL